MSPFSRKEVYGGKTCILGKASRRFTGSREYMCLLHCGILTMFCEIITPMVLREEVHVQYGVGVPVWQLDGRQVFQSTEVPDLRYATNISGRRCCRWCDYLT